MPHPTTAKIGLAIGAVMVGLGLFVALRLPMTGGRTLTGKLWLDLAFALFFLVRGGLYFSRFRKGT
jgi:hypothetical protein